MGWPSEQMAYETSHEGFCGKFSSPDPLRTVALSTR